MNERGGCGIHFRQPPFWPFLPIPKGAKLGRADGGTEIRPLGPPNVGINPPKGPGEATREGLERHLKEVTYQVPLPLPDFALCRVCDNRSDVNETPLKRPPGRPLRGSVMQRTG